MQKHLCIFAAVVGADGETWLVYNPGTWTEQRNRGKGRNAVRARVDARRDVRAMRVSTLMTTAASSRTGRVPRRVSVCEGCVFYFTSTADTYACFHAQHSWCGKPVCSYSKSVFYIQPQQASMCPSWDIAQPHGTVL